MICSTKVGTVVELEKCIYLSLVCGDRKVAEFCLAQEEYETLGVPKPSDVVAYSIVAATYNDGSSMRIIEIRFLGRPIKT